MTFSGSTTKPDAKPIGTTDMKLHNIAFNNLRRRKAKMFFLVLGLTIAVSTAVTLITLSGIMNADIANKLDEYGANILIVPRSQDLALSYGGMTVSGVAFDQGQLSIKDLESLKSIKNRDNIKIVAPKLLGAATVFQKNVLIVGVRFTDELKIKKWWKFTGEPLSRRFDAIVGAEVSRQLQLQLHQQFDVKEESFTVAAILEPTGSQDDEAIFVDLEEAQRLFGKPNQLNLIEVAALCSDCPIEEIVRQAGEKIPGARVTAVRQSIEAKMEANHRFQHFSFGISVVMMIVAGLIVLANMTASVNERTREIGVFRAIGFRRTHVLRIILTEALVTSSAAGILGYGIGLGMSTFIRPLLNIDAQVLTVQGYWLGGAALALSVGVGMLASIQPALKASRLDPSVALKSL